MSTKETEKPVLKSSITMGIGFREIKYYCPTCNNSIGGVNVRTVCCMCGQKVSWK